MSHRAFRLERIVAIVATQLTISCASIPTNRADAFATAPAQLDQTMGETRSKPLDAWVISVLIVAALAVIGVGGAIVLKAAPLQPDADP